ncbi:hypothetical protein LOTGIDRAFT_161605 [Lottia gigantea]|uniref:Uncharacterized protein n=1 Tax=Lottia gigantea TaxID=225164 RepID=V3ZQ40_LOTGI|nr:hypothetical protein LOTGIDRAFT_161605 [Lottia gigantea]ESO93503.1 hypothetical protein LOTGIDRAFT_161605 [Lottia gigantea]
MAGYRKSTKNFVYPVTCRYVRTLFLVILVILSQVTLTYSRASRQKRHIWERPGCTKVFHARVVKIPYCVEFRVETNACRGFCESYAHPSLSSTLLLNPNLRITSRSECCSITSTHDVTVRVWCIGTGWTNKTFKSAVDCGCSICRQD